MARNGFNERTSARVDAVEGLLAYASTQSRWSRQAIERVWEAVALSRELARTDPGAHTALLARSLRTAARLMLRRRRPDDALPSAEEAVRLARAVGGAPLILALGCLSEVLTALGRHEEAAVAMIEADKLT
ncbi:hypothetical protein [Nonomuraea soli]|uniref:Tetratricopeptide repeat protein n=1 Tax=Nonomuraea soli TaxID=1032476 RepID=A0A7W0HT05_9ACTN|nr:hypothetical protein [Nonomuraea soli]MBA2894579.1 hypothetical protein [Nonomuraea soli]